MRTMKASVVAVMVVAVALSAHTSWAAAAEAAAGGDSDAMLRTLYDDTHLPAESAGQQRSLKSWFYPVAPPVYQVASPISAPKTYTAPSPKPYVCYNSDIKCEFTAKVAVLLKGCAGYTKVTGNDYINSIVPRIQKRLERYNKAYKLHLNFSVATTTAGSVGYGQQKWFYFHITFNVGKCGQYKLPLITQLRGDIQPKAPFIKLVRVAKYPARG